MTQMVISLSNWSSDSFDWFQHGVCSGSCSETSTWSSLSNLEFNTSSNPAPTPDVDPQPEPTPDPTPDPSPAEYIFSDDSCDNITDQDCALVTNCSKCSWSYPVDDPNTWYSSNARCRCDPDGDSSPTPTGQFPGLTAKVDGVDT